MKQTNTETNNKKMKETTTATESTAAAATEKVSSSSTQPITTQMTSSSSTTTTRKSELEARLRAALWGFFSGDALAAPTHWYYGGIEQIRGDYGPAGIVGYTKPKTHLKGSILNKSNVYGGGRGSYYHSNAYSMRRRSHNYNKNSHNKKSEEKQKNNRVVVDVVPRTIIGDVIFHGKLQYWESHREIHYHATLASGENTLEAQLGRVLMKSIVDCGGVFVADHFRQAYVDFMTTRGSHNDTYASTPHRMFFANYAFHNKAPIDCPDNDGHNTDSINGLVLPTITALAYAARAAAATDDDDGADERDGSTTSDNDSPVVVARSREGARQAAAKTSGVTRRSERLEHISAVWSDLVWDAIHVNNNNSNNEGPTTNNDKNNDEDDDNENNNDNMKDSEASSSSSSSSSSWRACLNKRARELGLDRPPNPNGQDAMSECYLDQSLPTVMDMIAKYSSEKYMHQKLQHRQEQQSQEQEQPQPQQQQQQQDESNPVWIGLLANANVGGENVHRASLLGVVLGARYAAATTGMSSSSSSPLNNHDDDAIITRLKDGLYHKNELQQEIDDFVNAVLWREKKKKKTRGNEEGETKGETKEET